MRKELDDKLCQDFPLLYADRNKSMQETCMCWGFACGEGWYDIIRNLSAALENIIATLPEDNRPRAAQVKEKFGGLRFYMDGKATEEIRNLVRAAEALSFETCENCGEPGTLRTHRSWLLTLCDTCNQARDEKIKKEYEEYILKQEERKAKKEEPL